MSVFNRVISTSFLAFSSRRRDIAFGAAFSCKSLVAAFLKPETQHHGVYQQDQHHDEADAQGRYVIEETESNTHSQKYWSERYAHEKKEAVKPLKLTIDCEDIMPGGDKLFRGSCVHPRLAFWVVACIIVSL